MKARRLRTFTLWTGTLCVLIAVGLAVSGRLAWWRFGWFAAGTTSLVLLWLGRGRASPPGHCQRCGYDLTGLTEPRCPECGQPFEAKGDAP